MKTAPVAGTTASSSPFASGERSDGPRAESRPEETGGRTASGLLRPVRIEFADDSAREVFAVGSFNGWNPRGTPMRLTRPGVWSVELQLAPGEYRYRLLVDHEWRDDPRAARTAMNPYGGFDAVLEA
jgi:1,4-alpha-glucan branching enzyme